MLQEIKEAIRFRYVVYNYVYSSLKQKYRRSILGFLWSVAAPLMQNLVIGVVFYYLMRFDMPNYIVYLFAGSIIYTMISTVIMYSPGIMIQNEGFIKKVYMPKLVYVLQVVMLEAVNFVFILISLVILAIIFGKLTLSVHYLFLPVPVILAVFFLTGLAMFISIGTVYFRDLQHIVPVVMQAMFFLTPVLYPLSSVPEKFQKVVRLNPLYYFVDIFRSPILENRLPSLNFVALCVLFAAFSFLSGLYILHKNDNRIVFKL